MSFTKLALALLISALFLTPAKVVGADGSQNPPDQAEEVVIELAGSAFWNNAYYVDAVGDYAYLTMDFGLMIIDVSDKSDPQIASRLYMPYATSRLHVVGDYAYICGGGDLITGTVWATMTIVNVSDVYNPYIVSCYQSPDLALGRGVKVVGDIAYLAGGTGLLVINVSDPANPYQVSHISGNETRDIEVRDDIAFVMGSSRIYGADVSNPSDPWKSFGDIYYGGGGANGLEVANDLLYIANGSGGLKIVDPYNPPYYVLSDYSLGSWCYSLDLVLVDDTIVFIGGESSNSMKVLNVADPYAVDSIAKCGTPGQYARGMDFENDYLYVTRYEDGLYINDVSNRAWPTEVGVFREAEDEPITIEIRGNTGYVLHQDTIRIMDVSDPANMTQIGWAEFGMNNCLEIAGDLMLVGNTNGVVSIDISNPAAPVILDTCWTDHLVSSIDVQGDYAYITMRRWGYAIVDISDPSNLVVVSEYVDTDYWPAYDVDGTMQMIPIDDYALAGYYSLESLESGFLVFDISDPTNLQPLMEHALPNQLACMDIIGDQLFFAHWNIESYDSLLVWNIADPLNPVQIASWYPPGTSSFHANNISHAGGYLIVEDRYSHNLHVADPSGWSGGSGGAEVARFKNHREATDIATGGNHIYVTSLGGLTVLKLGLDFVCGDVNDDGGFGVDISDLVYLVDYMFTGGPPPPDMAAANIDGEPEITISDLVHLVDYMFNGGPPPIC